MPDSPQRSRGSYRWVICALLFFATTINYVDRAVLPVIEPELSKTIGWNATQYGEINSAFMLAYAFGSLGAGWMMDALGVRLGFAISLVFWSLAAASHAFARNVGEFALARFALGIGESGNFPASIKTVADWFPKKERALATGIFNAGSNMGAILRPAIVPFLSAGRTLADRIYRHRRRRANLGAVLVATVPPPRKPPTRIGRRARLHSQRSARTDR